MDFRERFRYMNPYDIHKVIINDYILKNPGDTKLLKRDVSKDKTDLDVIKEHHKFLWENVEPETWEDQFAKKYYDKLFKEYCISDLSRFKENKVAMRWRTEQEVVDGKGQFSCANKICKQNDELRTWEVNFAYIETGIKKNALVKVRLCPGCSKKLNYHTKKKEIKRIKDRTKKMKRKFNVEKCKILEDNLNQNKVESDIINSGIETSSDKKEVESPWKNVKPIETKSRDEEMEEYLQNLLL